MWEQLTPRVYHLRFSKKGNRPSLGYIRGDRFSLMVDAGNTPEHTQEYLDAVRQAGFRKPDFAVLTHSHWDHCFGMCALDIPTIACTQTRESLEMVSRLKWTPDALEEHAKKGILPRLCIPGLREQFPQLERIHVVLPTVIFSGSMRLDLGNCTCEIRHVVSPHAKDTVIVYVPEEKMVFLGDAIYQELVDDVWTERPEKLRVLLDTLEPLDFTLSQPAHQKAIAKDDLLAWFRRRIARAEQQTQQGHILGQKP